MAAKASVRSDWVWAASRLPRRTRLRRSSGQRSTTGSTFSICARAAAACMHRSDAPSPEDGTRCISSSISVRSTTKRANTAGPGISKRSRGRSSGSWRHSVRITWISASSAVWTPWTTSTHCGTTGSLRMWRNCTGRALCATSDSRPIPRRWRKSSSTAGGSI